MSSSGAGATWRRPRRLLLVAVITALALLAASVGRALTAPGSDSVSARLAEWGRGHGLSNLIDHLERVAYQAPKVGGVPSTSSPLSAGISGRTFVGPKPPTDPTTLAPIVPFSTPPVQGEGVWQVVASSQGRPALQVAYLRPDAIHTSYTAAVAWMDPALLRYTLHPGTQEPGGSGWSQVSHITAAERPSLIAAFNGGFRLDAAGGGFFENGRTAGTVRSGVATFAITSSGAGRVGVWARDFGPTDHLQAGRQNLQLIVDHARAVGGLNSATSNKWGRTLGNKLYVWRSGIGQTASGALVYVAGNRLSVSTLAEILRRAGAVRAMELDINPEWTSLVLYPQHKNLLPDMQRSASRYDRTSTRDFITVSCPTCSIS